MALDIPLDCREEGIESYQIGFLFSWDVPRATPFERKLEFASKVCNPAFRVKKQLDYRTFTVVAPFRLKFAK